MKWKFTIKTTKKDLQLLIKVELIYFSVYWVLILIHVSYNGYFSSIYKKKDNNNKYKLQVYVQSEWVIMSDSCLMSHVQCFSDIMSRTSYIQ